MGRERQGEVSVAVGVMATPAPKSMQHDNATLAMIAAGSQGNYSEIATPTAYPLPLPSANKPNAFVV